MSALNCSRPAAHSASSAATSMGDARTVIKRTAAGVFLAGAEMMNMNKASPPPKPSAFGQALDDKISWAIVAQM